MSVLKRKSSIALIVGIIVTLLIIAIWCTKLEPYILASELEKIDAKTSFEGTLDYFGTGLDIPILIEAHAYVEDVKGDNVVLKVEMNITRTDTNETLSDLSGNSTYVFNKFTLKNTPDAAEADKPREGYDPVYPLHLKAGEGISNVWLDMLNKTGTLEFEGIVKEEGVTLYKYFVNETITKEMNPGLVWGNYTLTSTKTVLIEPLSGLLVYTENETFSIVKNYTDSRGKIILTKLIYLTYTSTAEAKAQGIADAKATHDDLQQLESYVQITAICPLGVIVIVLIVGLVFNVKRLKRKEPPEKRQFQASRARQGGKWGSHTMKGNGDGLSPAY